jgi:hypothetical protein
MAFYCVYYAIGVAVERIRRSPLTTEAPVTIHATFGFDVERAVSAPARPITMLNQTVLD